MPRILRKGIPTTRSSVTVKKEAKSSESEDDRYDVEAILRHRIVNGTIKLLVHWKGYTSVDSTWEPIENVDAGEIIDSYLVTEVLGKKKKANDFDYIVQKMWEGKPRKRFALGRGLVDADVSDDETGESAPVAGTAIGDFLQHMAKKVKEADEREREDAKRAKMSAAAGPSSSKKSKKA